MTHMTDILAGLLIVIACVGFGAWQGIRRKK
jgi:hypothetical protein